MKLNSLRARLILIILPPLLLISLVAGAWQFHNTTLRAESIFDKGLLSAAIAISRDVALSDGDAISPSTRRLLTDTSGGTIFYHVYAPDGVFVTGFSTPPVLPSGAPKRMAEPFYFNSVYQGEKVRVLRFQDVTVVSGVAGLFNITVWQSADVRSSFVRSVLSRSFAVIAGLVLSVAVVVWFGVRLGLRPLLELERAIALRTPSELEPIRRRVPTEAQGLVTTLNELLNRVSRRISSKDEFISNAAHQLRNPVAGVLALAEAVQTAPNVETAKQRSAELVDAAREASELTNKLLSFERASGADIAQSAMKVELQQLLRSAISTFEQQYPHHGLEFEWEFAKRSVYVLADATMLQEAILNLLSNALIHGGPDVSKVHVTLTATPKQAVVIISDNGRGIAPDRHLEALSRFSQARGGPGSGLGLAIAARVVKNHGGELDILPCESGASVRLVLKQA